ncbi:MAG: type IX secretion system membrane protein PorP/SprF [Bacteroidales bacterium]
MELLRKIVVSFVFFCALTVVYSQQQPQFTHNMFNKAYTNPGFFGITNAICATGIIRQQWVGFKDADGNKVAPETVLVAIDAPIKFLRGGVGLNIAQDQYGFFKDVTIRLGYSYHRTMGEGKLGIGLNVDFLNKSLEFSKLKAVEEGDNFLNSQSSNGVIITDLGVGAFLQLPGFYAGFSALQLLQSKRDLGGAGVGTFNLKRHYYLTSGYDLTFPSNPSYIITPSIFIKSDGVSVQYDFNGLVKYNNKIWGGVTYRLNDAFGILIGTVVKEVNIGYAYDIPTSMLGSAGSHEIMVKYCFKLEREKTRTSYRNTRFL